MLTTEKIACNLNNKIRVLCVALGVLGILCFARYYRECSQNLHEERNLYEKINVRDGKKVCRYEAKSLHEVYFREIEKELERPNAKTDDVGLQRAFHRFATYTGYYCVNQVRFGPHRGDGGYYVCLDEPFQLKPKECLVYSFGSRNEFDLEDAIYKQYQCEIHTFDPSVDIKSARKEDNERNHRTMYYHLLGIAAEDSGSHKPRMKFHGFQTPTWTMMTFSSILNKLKHTEKTLDIVKIDIEHYEYDVLRSMIDNNQFSKIKQLIVEFHTSKFKHEKIGLNDFRYMSTILTDLERIGFRKFASITSDFAIACCILFHQFASTNVTHSGRPVCCYEVHYINTMYL